MLATYARGLRVTRLHLETIFYSAIKSKSRFIVTRQMQGRVGIRLEWGPRRLTTR